MRFRIFGIVALGLALATVVAVHIYGRGAPAFFGVSYDYRGASRERIGGARNIGIYVADGQIGFLLYTHVWGYTEPDMPVPPAEPMKGRWGHDGAEGISADLQYFQKWCHLGLSAYDGSDFGLGNEYSRTGYFLRTWILELVLALALAWAIWRGVSRKPVKPGHCRACGYDIRTQLAAGGNCPECGTAVARAQAA